MQAYAALYAWDLTYRLDENPFKKCPSTTVLSTLRKYATDFKLREHTQFGSAVTTIKKQDGRYPLPPTPPGPLLKADQSSKSALKTHVPPPLLLRMGDFPSNVRHIKLK